MQKKIELIRVTNSGDKRYWSLELDGDTLTTHWGQLNGKLQSTSDKIKPVNVGKSNELSGEEAASQEFDRQVRDQKLRGYREGEESSEDDSSSHPFQNDELIESVKFYKPSNTLSSRVSKSLLQKDNGCIFLRKYDGMMMIIYIDSSREVKIYSRTVKATSDNEPNIKWAARFQNIVTDIQKLNLPANTILLGEMVAFKEDDTDDFQYVSKVMNSLTPEAIELQKKRPLFYVVWDLAYYDSSYLLDNTIYSKRIQLINSLIDQQTSLTYLKKAESFSFETIEEAKEYISVYNYEGFIVRDKNDLCIGVKGEDIGYVLSGEPKRPVTCCKLKLEFEDDFIAKWDPVMGFGSYGKGKLQDSVGTVSLFQINSEGKEVYICECGGGLADKHRKSLAENSNFEQVWRVKYNARKYISQGDTSNALTFPRYEMTRTDKTKQECINDLL